MRPKPFILQPKQPMPRKITHGRPGTYASGCRCEPCRLAWLAYKKERRKRLGRRVDVGTKKAKS